MKRSRTALAAAGLASVLIGCGGGVPARTCSPAPTARPPQAAGTRVTAAADRATVAPGGTVTFTVVASGATRYNAPCSGPLELVVDDASQLGVYAASAAVGPASPCGAVALAAGGRAVYSVSWPVDPTLPEGGYEATLVLGDLPTLRLSVTVQALQLPC